MCYIIGDALHPERKANLLETFSLDSLKTLDATAFRKCMPKLLVFFGDNGSGSTELAYALKTMRAEIDRRIAEERHPKKAATGPKPRAIHTIGLGRLCRRMNGQLLSLSERLTTVKREIKWALDALA